MRRGRDNGQAMTKLSRRRIELDIGCGHDGQFALAIALENPDAQFIGIDINEHSFASAEAARHRLNIDNVQFVHGEAYTWLRDFVPDAAIDAFHLYFPTPYVGALRRTNLLGANLTRWLFARAFVRELRRAAAPGATLRVMTDSQPYFEHVRRVADAAGLAEIEWSDPLQNKPVDHFVGTGCEREMRRINRPISRVQYLFV